MRLPNKLFSYDESLMPLLPRILNLLEEPTAPKELFLSLDYASLDPLLFIDALDCLFALHKIELTRDGMLTLC